LLPIGKGEVMREGDAARSSRSASRSGLRSEAAEILAKEGIERRRHQRPIHQADRR
jgi:hypothetical protein